MKSATAIAAKLWNVKWQTLRGLGNSTAVKLTIFIPIIGYLVIFNETVVKYIDLSQRFLGQSSETYNEWRLIFVYFGLFHCDCVIPIPNPLPCGNQVISDFIRLCLGNFAPYGRSYARKPTERVARGSTCH